MDRDRPDQPPHWLRTRPAISRGASSVARIDAIESAFRDVNHAISHQAAPFNTGNAALPRTRITDIDIISAPASDAPPSDDRSRARSSGSALRGHFKLAAAATLWAAYLAAPSSAVAGERETSSSLATGLYRLANSRHVELLFDERLLAGKSYSAPAAGTTVEQALARILAGTGLTFRRLPSGAFVIVADRRSADGNGLEPLAAAPAVADILVIGRRTLDVDIRRSADDAQPYRAIGRRELESAQPATIDELLKTRLPQNSQTISLNQAPLGEGGAVRSQIDLRGLGAAQTLVLINGRRLPGAPGPDGLLQPDVNGLPVHSVERIETLASTAGGIFGIGAAGGVVNLITRNDFDDATLVLRSGVSQKGDAAQRLVDAHVGLTSRSGHTRASVRFARATDDGLEFGSRPFVQRSRLLRYERVGAQLYQPVSAGVNIVSADGSDLSLLPSLGGQSLGASQTHLPAGASPLTTAGISTLLTNAGTLDLTPAIDGQGSRQSLLTPSETNSVMATVRQDLSAGLEVYADYLRFETTGRATVPAVGSRTELVPGEQGNPFQQSIVITYPTVGLLGETRSTAVTDRLTLGAILRLGGGWVANLDAASGLARVREATRQILPYESAVAVFAGGETLTDQLSRLSVEPFTRNTATNRLRDLNFRAAGPLATLPAGQVSVTVTAEYREEGGREVVSEIYPADPALHSTTLSPTARQRVGSLFAETRLPLFRAEGPFSPLRGLEAQIAVRSDRYEIEAPVTAVNLVTSGAFGKEVRSSGTVTAVTASLRVEPISGVTLRGSFADGYTPPTQTQITPQGASVPFLAYADPKRPRDSLLSTVQTLYLAGGQPGLRPQHSRTLSAGTIIEPGLLPGLRFSVDFAVLRTDHEITDFALGQFQYIIDNEALYPGRITRTSLTAADVAAGYTAGRITKIDAGFLSTGRSTLKTLDVALDYQRATALGRLRAYGQATWEPTLRRGAQDAQSYNSVNSLNGPVSIRASGSIELSRGPWTYGLAAQAYGSYRITYSYQPGSLTAVAYQQFNVAQLAEQGASHVPAQAYVDAWTSFTTKGVSALSASPAVSYRVGIRNLLNKAPPLVIPSLPLQGDPVGYSTLGDPRGRRFELEVTTSF